ACVTSPEPPPPPLAAAAVVLMVPSAHRMPIPVPPLCGKVIDVEREMANCDAPVAWVVKLETSTPFVNVPEAAVTPVVAVMVPTETRPLKVPVAATIPYFTRSPPPP